MKKKLLKTSLMLLTVAAFFMIGCSKEDSPIENVPPPVTHIPGTVEGTMQLNGASSVNVSGASTNSSFGYIMSARNMNPPNSYPSVNIAFSAKPTKDSTYIINTSNSASVSTSDDTQNNQYFATSGSIVVTKSGSTITARFTNLTFHNTFTGDTIASASLTAY